jgi:two-component system chemotaxis response regulator CheB
MIQKIKVLVVDDSALMRKKICDIINNDKELEVIASARDGEDAVNKARELRPDVITMDVNMPGMDGLTALQYIISENICPVVMLSSLTQEGAIITFEALELGAFDFVAKPGGTISLKLEEVAKELVTKVKFAAKSGTLEKIQRFRQNKRRWTEKIAEKKAAQQLSSTEVTKAVAIGVSTGGPKVLSDIIGDLPADLNAVVFIVQHIPPNFTASFADRLNKLAKFTIKEAETGELLKNNIGYLGKGGYQLLINRLTPNVPPRIRLSTKPNHLFMPSVDIMMESVVNIFEERTIGVLLTGMGSDGADGMVKIRKKGGITIAESEETAIVFGMPSEAISRGGAEIIAPSYRIADKIVESLNRIPD